MLYSKLRVKLEGAACELMTHAYGLSHAERTLRMHEIALLAGQTLAAAEDLQNHSEIAASIDALMHRVQSHIGLVEQGEKIRLMDPPCHSPFGGADR
ncbi:hypothetical protein [Stenotrophomonas sp.]|uniref:hypothetical protein n=1 Tax=Stenotrophomonas sp. TaxID=69392 RepID=UPI0028A89DBA|nr:hypothetical protein [Stenotrophomonas sp.]